MFQRQSEILVTFLILLVTGVMIEKSYGQAYCALRDPTKRIYESYPDATSYRSLVRTVDQEVRQYVSGKLPFTIHFNELGRHTLYLPVNGDRPIGLVHARSEAGNWGLSEIVWSLSPDLVVEDFQFQRCRSRKRSVVEKDAFKKQLIGKDFQQLKAMLSEDGSTLSNGKVTVAADAQEMAATVIRSALKTIAVTEFTWKQELKVIQPLHHVNQAFPNTVRIEKINQPYSAAVIEIFQSAFKTSSGKDSSSIKRSSVEVYKSIATDESEAGFVVKTPWEMDGTNLKLWWYVRNDGVISAVNSQGGWPTPETQKAFESVVGLATDKIRNCSSAAEIAGAEVLLLVRRSGARK